MIDDAATPRRGVNMIRKGFLEFDVCNDRLKLVLVTCKQFCSLTERCGVSHMMDFKNTSHVV